MRHLYLLRGNVGAGKSYWLKQSGFSPYTLCADDIRLQLQSPVLTPKGVYAISPENDRKVWGLLFEMLETRMERGELVFIDATHSKASDFSKYKKLAQEYRYRIYCIDFSAVSIDTCKTQNWLRSEYKRVPESVLDNIDSRLKSQPVPTYVHVVTPETYTDVFDYAPLELSTYKAIHIIGDIHGCFEPLKLWADLDIKKEDYYIFVGDYIDRGIQNAEVVNWLLSIYEKPNVLLLEGNHERWLRYWANEEPLKVRSNEFLFQTAKELDSRGVNKSEVRQLCRRFAQVAYFRYKDKLVLVNHGGISKLPTDLITVATEQFIKGVGRYDDMLEVAESWANNSPDNAIQVAGHRNVSEAPTKINPKFYNLQGNIEFGGNLRIVSLHQETDEITITEIPNTVFRPRNIKIETTLGPASFVEELRKNKYVKERAFGDISSFNFSQTAFYKKIWDGMTVKARGLFVNTRTNEIVARSYNKFFNINEQEGTKIETASFQYPMQVYIKYNGFLGMVGHDTASNQVLFLSKGSVEGVYPELFKRVWALTTNVDPEHLKTLLVERNITLVFEVIDQDEDPHIISYPESKELILLDAVRRTLDYEKLPYQELVAIAHELNMPLSTKHLYKTLNSKEELLQFYKECETMQTPDIEGFVLEDSNGFMMKLKLPYYNFWKHMRVVKEAVRSRRQVNLSGLTTPEANYFYAWLKTQTEEELSQDIIKLRKKYYEEKET